MAEKMELITAIETHFDAHGRLDTTKQIILLSIFSPYELCYELHDIVLQQCRNQNIKLHITRFVYIL